MKKILVTFNDSTAKVLAKYPNQSAVIRKAVELYIEHISTDTIDGIRTSYKLIGNHLKEIDTKLDYIANKVQ